jgi:chromosome segregation ATPase
MSVIISRLTKLLAKQGARWCARETITDAIEVLRMKDRHIASYQHSLINDSTTIINLRNEFGDLKDEIKRKNEMIARQRDAMDRATGVIRHRDKRITNMLEHIAKLEKEFGSKDIIIKYQKLAIGDLEGELDGLKDVIEEQKVYITRLEKEDMEYIEKLRGQH